MFFILKFSSNKGQSGYLYLSYRVNGNSCSSSLTISETVIVCCKDSNF